MIRSQNAIGSLQQVAWSKPTPMHRNAFYNQSIHPNVARAAVRTIYYYLQFDYAYRTRAQDWHAGAAALGMPPCDFAKMSPQQTYSSVSMAFANRLGFSYRENAASQIEMTTNYSLFKRMCEQEGVSLETIALPHRGDTFTQWMVHSVQTGLHTWICKSNGFVDKGPTLTSESVDSTRPADPLDQLTLFENVNRIGAQIAERIIDDFEPLNIERMIAETRGYLQARFLKTLSDGNAAAKHLKGSATSTTSIFDTYSSTSLMLSILEGAKIDAEMDSSPDFKGLIKSHCSYLRMKAEQECAKEAVIGTRSVGVKDCAAPSFHTAFHGATVVSVTPLRLNMKAVSTRMNLGHIVLRLRNGIILKAKGDVDQCRRAAIWMQNGTLVDGNVHFLGDAGQKVPTNPQAYEEPDSGWHLIYDPDPMRDSVLTRWNDYLGGYVVEASELDGFAPSGDTPLQLPHCLYIDTEIA